MKILGILTIQYQSYLAFPIPVPASVRQSIALSCKKKSSLGNSLSPAK